MAEVDTNIDPAKKGSYEFSNIETYGDLKKLIKSISTDQKIGNIKSQGKSFALDQLLGFFPGASNAKTAYDFIKAAISKPDTKKSGTWLDKLDIDDSMSKIVDDTVENGFMQAVAASIEKEPDTKLLEPDFNMNAKMTNYLKQQYAGRTVAGIKENMDLKEYIKSLVRELLDEESTSGNAGPYSTPFAFAKKGQGPNAATKQAEKSGWKLAKKPTTSKIVDYKKIFEVGKDDVGKDFLVVNKDGKKIEASYKGIRGDGEYMFDTGKEMIYIKEKDINTKISPMNESLKNIIRQELLNEVTYSKFKKEVKHRTKSEQLHKAIREVKRKLAEIDRIVEYTSRMKQELSEDEGGLSYWKATQNNIGKISEMVNHLNNKIKNLHQ